MNRILQTLFQIIRETPFTVLFVRSDADKDDRLTSAEFSNLFISFDTDRKFKEIQETYPSIFYSEMRKVSTYTCGSKTCYKMSTRNEFNDSFFLIHFYVYVLGLACSPVTMFALFPLVVTFFFHILPLNWCFFFTFV